MSRLASLDHVRERCRAHGWPFENSDPIARDPHVRILRCPACRDGSAAVATWDGAGVRLECRGCEQSDRIRDALLADPSARAESTPLAYISLDTVTMRSIEWLEKPLWQRSAFHLLAGVKGAGKGTYTAMLAAKITRGRLQGGARTVVFVSSEDSLEVDLTPRLTAAGADLTRCKFITDTFKLPADLDRLRATLAALGDVGMVVIDPVANHIGARNSNDEAEVRDSIAPLNTVADEFGCLVVGIRHVGKNRTGGALVSILGSTAWVDTPRAVVMIALDDEADDVRHIQVVAGNRSATRGGVMFRIEGVMLDGLEEEVTRAVDLGESMKDIDDLLAPEKKPDSKTGKARELVLDVLEASPTLSMESDALDAQVAKTTGLAAKTVQNVRSDLKKAGLIKARPDLNDQGQPERWIVFRTGAPR